MAQSRIDGEPRVVRLSTLDAKERGRLLAIYEHAVYAPAFPDAEIREDPAYWLELLDADPHPEPPQPKIEVILLVTTEGTVAGGATVEHYRAADCGLLTYLAVAADRRGQGLGRTLLAEARAALATMAGGARLLFAETERLDEVASEAERKATIERQGRLAGLGARLVDFTYWMPPLRPGLPVHRLHLLVFDHDEPVPGRLVLRLLTELAQALRTDLARFKQTRVMAERLHADPLLPLKPLPATPRSLDEAPVFLPGFGAASFSFVFEIEGPPPIGPGCNVFEDGKDRYAFQLRDIVKEIEKDKLAYDKLVEPVRSFLDDITTGKAGSNGRPLIMAASAADEDHPSRTVKLIRPEFWTYDYEGATTYLYPAEARRSLGLRLRDSFAIFESGRIFYILTLTTEGDVHLDEYDVIQLQQLAIDEAEPGSGFLGFLWEDRTRPGSERPEGADWSAPLSLVDLVNQRLAQLPGADPAAEPSPGADNAVAVLVQLKLIEAEWEPVEACDFKNLCISIEDPALLEIARTTFDSIPRPREEAPVREVRTPAALADAIAGRLTLASPALAVTDPRLSPDRSAAMSVHAARSNSLCAKLEEGWTATNTARPVTSRNPHREGKESFDRALLALAGLTQGVPDFPNQDASEVYDATRPTAHSVESALYWHPKFILEVAENWRSFARARPSLGTCPYLLLTFVVATHDELVVTTMERRLDQLLFEHGNGATAVQTVRVSPLGPVRELLAKARRIRGGGLDILQTNLEHRFELFRWGSIHRSGNIFRYAKEKTALRELHEAMAIPGRFADVHALIDRLESLVEDAANLKSLYAQSRTNLILLMLALFGIISATSDLGTMTGLPMGWLAALLAMPIAFALIVRMPARRMVKGFAIALVVTAALYVLVHLLLAMLGQPIPERLPPELPHHLQ